MTKPKFEGKYTYKPKNMSPMQVGVTEGGIIDGLVFWTIGREGLERKRVEDTIDEDWECDT